MLVPSLPLNMTQKICFGDPSRSLDRLVDLLQVSIHCAVEIQFTGGWMQGEVACAIDEAIDFLHFQRSHGFLAESGFWIWIDSGFDSGLQ